MRFKKIIERFFYSLPLTWRVYIYFLFRHKYTLSLSNPLTFSEKINYRKLHPHEMYSMLADKYLVRDYVSEKIGGEYLVPLKCLLFDSSEFPELEGEYVAKTTHGSGPDNLEFLPSNKTLEELKEKFGLALARDFRGVSLGELHYSSVARRILIEEKIGGDELPVDFKFHMFENNGDPKWFLQIDSGRYKKHIRNYYDSNLLLLDLQVLHPNGEYNLPNASHIERMSKLALKLAVGLSYARVDLYLVKDKIYFGEITLTPGSGFEKFSRKALDIEWGRYWN